MKKWIAIAGTCAAVGGGVLFASCDRADTETDGETRVRFERYEASTEASGSEPTAQPSDQPARADEPPETGESKPGEPKSKPAKTEITVLGVERDDPDSEETDKGSVKKKKKVDIKKAVAEDVSALQRKQKLQALPNSLSNIKRIPTNLDIDNLPVQKGQGSEDGQKK